MSKKIIVIGGGASGLMAACAAGAASATVTVLERKDRVGKKILATGNGRCNLSNLNAAPSFYHGEDPLFTEPALRRFGPEKTIQNFHELGLWCRTEENRVYPMCNQASAVLDVLRGALSRTNVDVRQTDVMEVVMREGRFMIKGRGGEQFIADRVILSTGGCASPSLGSEGGGYPILEKFGHSITPLYPALTPLRSDSPWIKPLRGIRVRAGIAIQNENRVGVTNCFNKSNQT